MRRRWLRAIFVTFLFLVMAASGAEAGVGHLAMMYGILPNDVALAGAGTAGFGDAAAVYHNPAAIAETEHTLMTMGYLFAQPMFRGGHGGRERDFREPNAVVAMGTALDIGKIFASDYPVAMGITMLVDDNMGTLLNFDDERYPEGNYQRFGVRSFMTITSWGVRVFRGLNVGGGFILSSKSEVTLDQDVQLSGRTENEQMTLTGHPAYGFLAGVQYVTTDWRIGAAYRGELQSVVDPVSGETRVKAGEFVFQEYPTDMQFKDGFIPQMVSAGATARIAWAWHAVGQVDWQNWDRMNSEMREGDDAIRDSDIRTRDVWVPRIGTMLEPAPEWQLRAGYAYEASPFERWGSGNNLVLDNDLHRLSAGFGFSIHPRALRTPVTFDAAAFYAALVPREERTSDDQLLNSSGYLIGGSTSVTLRF